MRRTARDSPHYQFPDQFPVMAGSHSEPVLRNRGNGRNRCALYTPDRSRDGGSCSRNPGLRNRLVPGESGHSGHAGVGRSSSGICTRGAGWSGFARQAGPSTAPVVQARVFAPLMSISTPDSELTDRVITAQGPPLPVRGFCRRTSTWTNASCPHISPPFVVRASRCRCGGRGHGRKTVKA